ncbi:PepSY-associated TM helix domain-containing protein [Pseudochelatococcus sp. B33]
MTGSFRQSMAQFHTWVGLIAGWILFVVFLSGTLAYVQDEITQWARPELRGETTPRDAAERAVIWAGNHVPPTATQWQFGLAGERSNISWVFWRDGGSARRVILDAAGKEVRPRDSAGGGFFLGFHYNLQYMPWFWGRWIVGAAAMAGLVGTISGIIIHKKLFADFFTLRLGKGQRSWLDAHNIMGVLTLPFLLMITYTGLVVSMWMYVPGVAALIPSDGTQTIAGAPPMPPTGVDRLAPLTPIGPVLDKAIALWNGYQPGSLLIRNPGTAAAVIEVRPAGPNRLDSLANDTLVFDGVTGELRSGHPRKPPALIHSIHGVMHGLHEGRFASPVLRWLYFLSGLAGTLMIAVGLILWTVKRRQRLPDPQRPPFGFRLVEGLNIATLAGFPAGIAVYFLSNRLLPTDMEARAAWEIHSLFITWGLAAIWTVIRPARRAWIETLTVAGALYAAVPVVSALTTDRGLIPSLIAGDRVFICFDTVMLLAAALFALAARKVATHRPQAARRRKGASKSASVVEASS